MERRRLDFAELQPPLPYRMLTALVLPRPIAWVSTLSAQGVANLAPHSFFTVASAEPPVVQFTSVGRKDSLTNIEQTGEFVVNFASRNLMDQMNQTAATVTTEVDEFQLAGLAKQPSDVVAPPRVADSPAALECVLHQVVPVGDCFLVLGRVVSASVDEAVFDGRYPDAARLDPVARLGGARYVAFGEVLTMERPG